SLIRDTEPHERALFSAPPPPPSASLRAAEPDDPKVTHRRQTVFNVALGEVTAGPPGRRSSHYPRPHTAVAAVLGGEMHEQIRDRRGDLDVEVLLRGAEKLCGVYELPGTRERIAALRDKHRRGMNTAAYYEAKVAEQAEQLAGMKKGWMDDDDNDDNHDQQQCMQDPWGMNGAWTEDG
ncbi:dash complex subunit spc34, partial [Lasius niger]